MIALIAVAAIAAPSQRMTMTAYEAQSGFKPLFDGQSTSGWKGWKKPDVPAAWSVENGVLTIRPGSQGGDICTVEEYGDFDLRLEWKSSKGGNSGVIYRAGEDYDTCWKSGPEYQIFDDYAYGAKANKTSAGSLYDVYAPSAFVTRPIDQWNETRIVLQGNHIQHWLNNVLVVDCLVGSDEWNAKYAASKFKSYPLYAKKPKGYIVLQDHGAEISFRKVRIKTF